jgi:hypothetical protein
MGFGDEYMVLAGVGFLFNFLGALALIAAAGAALYAAVQIKKVIPELRKQTRLLQKLAGEEPTPEPPKEDA